MMGAITNPQKAKIWVSAKELSLNKEELYNIIYSCSQKTSMRDLSIKEAKSVIDALVRLGATVGKRKRYKKRHPKSTGNIIALISPAQRNKILALMHSLDWDEDTLDSFAERILTKKLKSKLNARYRTWRCIPKEYAADLIEGLKGVIQTNERANTRG